jgi:hypothetical protein
MFWDKWFKKSGQGSENAVKPVKLHKPTELPAEVGRDMVVRLGKDPDWVWNLRAVAKPSAGSPYLMDVRVFSPAAVAAKRILVKNYHSLDEHPDMVLFDGWYNKKTHEANLNDHSKPRRQAA